MYPMTRNDSIEVPLSHGMRVPAHRSMLTYSAVSNLVPAEYNERRERTPCRYPTPP